MEKFNDETRQVINMVNHNAAEKRESALHRSMMSDSQKLRKSKRNNFEQKRKQAIATLLIVSSLIGTAALTNKVTTEVMERNNVIISLADANDVVDGKIRDYESLMGVNSDRSNAIEIPQGRNFETDKYELLVSYDTNNLAKHIKEASKKSETDARCVIIAAFRIINEPYRESNINEALALASAEQDDCVYKIPDSSDKFLQELGYESWDEYRLNERKNIKDLYAASEYVNNYQERTK